MSATAPGVPIGNRKAAEIANPWSGDAFVARIKSSPDFIELEHKRKTFGWSLTILMLVIYYGFIALVAFVPSVIGLPVSGSITLGLVLGIAVILSAIVLTGIYVWRANGEFDRLQSRVVAQAARL